MYRFFCRFLGLRCTSFCQVILIHFYCAYILSLVLSLKKSVFRTMRTRGPDWHDLEASREKSPAFPFRCLFSFKRLKRKQVPGVFWKPLFPVESRDQTGTVFNQFSCDADTDTFSSIHTHWLPTNTTTDQMKQCVPDTDTNTLSGYTKWTNMYADSWTDKCKLRTRCTDGCMQDHAKVYSFSLSAILAQ